MIFSSAYYLYLKQWKEYLIFSVIYACELFRMAGCEIVSAWDGFGHSFLSKVMDYFMFFEDLLASFSELGD